MKRIALPILTFFLSASILMTGCSSEKSPSSGATSDPASSTPETPSSSQSAPADDSKVEPTVLGTLQDNVYTNEYVNFGCKLDETWTMLGAEDLQTLPQEIGDILKDTDIGDSIGNTPQIMDLLAQNTESGANVNVLYTQMTSMERIAYLAMKESDVIDSVLKQKDLLTQSYEQAGFKVKTMEKSTVQFLGEERTCIKTTLDVNGTEMIQIQLFDFQLKGKYNVTTTFGGLTEQAVTDLMDQFYRL